ncbi:MAG: hypothetical protein GX171_02575 [Clostridiales bacterium]|jgi:hypothetical protein|nr:hypothetical protein [Clostridiales bacterium]
MTTAEVTKLVGLLVVAYPSYDRFKDQDHIRSTVALWSQMFADDDFRLVQLALEKHIATSKWPPSIAELRDIMADIQQPGLLPVDEAWRAVTKLMGMHERLYGPTAEHLPGPIAQAVDTVGYDQLVELSRAAAQGRSNKVGLDRVAFTQAYEAIRTRIREHAGLPGKLQVRLNNARQHYADGSEKLILRLEEQYQERWERQHPSVQLLQAADEEEPLGLPEPD